MTEVQMTETCNEGTYPFVAPGFPAGRSWFRRPPGVEGGRYNAKNLRFVRFRSFEFEALEFVSDFVLRISNLVQGVLGFDFARRGSRALQTCTSPCCTS
jgi:hypothetical protein